MGFMKRKSAQRYANSASAAFVKKGKATSSAMMGGHDSDNSDSEDSEDEDDYSPTKYITVAPPRRNPEAKRPKMAFKVELAEEKNSAGKIIGEHYVCTVKPRSRAHNELLDFIRNITLMSGFWGDAHMDGKRPKKQYKVPLSLFVVYYNDIYLHRENLAYMHSVMNMLPSLFDSFMDMVGFYYHEIVDQFEAEKKQGDMSFMATLFYLNRSAGVVTRFMPNEPLQGLETSGVQRLQVRCHQDLNDISCNISGKVYRHTGKFFRTDSEAVCLRANLNTLLAKKKPEAWKVWPMNAEYREKMTAFGERYVECAVKPTHMQYYGEMSTKVGFWSTTINLNSRVVIDIKNYHNQDQQNAEDRPIDPSKLERGNYIKLPKDKVPYTDNTIEGFSLKTKQWGVMRVDSIEPLEYDEKAYDYLVLDPKKKHVIRCFVEDHFRAEGNEMDRENSGQPIILTKSQGKIFLLQGPCGTGKTLTAEAISDLVKCPLYSIAVGELGCDPQEMERRLSRVLNLATQWKAVVLIDEADIFLERRTTSDIQRNALVGIFLRVLEYYRGILFLTTNRIDAFDEAFFSRVSLNLNYPALDFQSRKDVLESIIKQMKLNGAGLVTPEVERALDTYNLNGRTIKTALSLAKTLAVSDGSKHIEAHHLLQCLELVSHSTTNASDINNVMTSS